MARRGPATLRRIPDEHPGKDVLVVAHGPLIRPAVSARNGEARPRVGGCDVVPARVPALGTVAAR